MVDEDGTPYPDLVAQQPGVGEFGLEAVVGSDLLPGMGLPGIDEEPSGAGMPLGRFT